MFKVDINNYIIKKILKNVFLRIKDGLRQIVEGMYD